jgi:nickel superoxide dismutase
MRTIILHAVALAAALGIARVAAAHCEVPCGIYADQRRFEQMLEDCDTIAKAMKSISDLMLDAPDPTAVNQAIRWTTTKESHATNTQHVVAQYFLTQRIKADSDRYVEQLKAAHGVMVAAMKCKQTVEPANADKLRKAIHDLYRAYEGKEPTFEKK